MSRPKKRENPFGPHQEANQSHRGRLIIDALKVLKKGRLRFDYLTHLATFVAKHISDIEGTPLVPSTLLRNVRYKALLQHAYDSDLKVGAKGEAPISSRVAGPAANRQLQIENSNLRQENLRLKARLSELGSSGAIGSNAVALPPAAMRPYELDFIQTCQALEKVLEVPSLFIEVDSRGAIINKEKRVDNIIAEARLMVAFVKWRQTKSGRSS